MATNVIIAGELNHKNIGQQITVNLWDYGEDGDLQPTWQKRTGTIHAIDHTAQGTTIIITVWYNNTSSQGYTTYSQRYTTVRNPHTAFVSLLEPQE